MIVARVPASGLASDDAVGADARDGHGQGGHAVEAAVEIGVAGDADGVDVARAVRLDQDFEEARCFLAGETRRKALAAIDRRDRLRSEEHTSELQSLMRISYAVFCLKKKKQKNNTSDKTQSINKPKNQD